MKLKLLLPITVFLLPIISPGQITKEIDSVNRIAFSIAKDYPDSCKKLTIYTISTSDSLNYQKGLADGYHNMGEYYYVSDSLFQAMVNYLKALRIYEQLDPSIELSTIYKQLASFNVFMKKDNSAIEYRLKSIEVLENLSITESVHLFDSYHGIGHTYMAMGKYDSAIIYNVCNDSIEMTIPFSPSYPHQSYPQPVS